MASTPLATFMITTFNRADELPRTIESCLAQTWPAKEVLVVDDASTDGTADLLQRQFPQVTVIRNHKNRGSIASRNEILQRARGEYIIALDDDSRFLDTDACARIVERMEAEPDLGAVAFQAIGPEFPERTMEGGRLSGEWHCNSFACCGAALRKSVLQQTGLFPQFFWHAYEEPDLALRIWDAGYRVLQWNEIVVYHEFTPLNRNEQRTHRRHARNEACSIWMRYPWRLVPFATLARLAGQARFAASRGWLLKEPRVWIEFLLRIPQAVKHRQPVSERAVRLAVALNRVRTADPQRVWELAELPWSEIFNLPVIRDLHRTTFHANPQAPQS